MSNYNSIKKCFNKINKENVEFLLNRYNKINRWIIGDIFKRSGYRYPDKIALSFKDINFTYNELDSEINKVANALIDLGVEKYDRVAIIAHNTLHHVLTWFACTKIGAIYLAINYLLNGPEIEYCINHSESKVFIIEDELFPKVESVLKNMKTIKNFIWSNQGSGLKTPDNNFFDFDKWYKSFPDKEPDTVVRIEDPCQMTYTSGTESKPKGVIINHQSLISQYISMIIDGGFAPEDISINALPIYHCAQRDAFLTPLFYIGGTNVLIRPDIEEILFNIDKWNATMFFAPPTVWIGILRHPSFNKYNLSKLKKLYYGAAIMPVEIIKELLEKFEGSKLYNAYGQTELAPLHTILKSEYALTKLGSVGKGVLNMQTRLEDDNGNPVELPGVIGEISGKGPHTMIMYFKDFEKTEEAMRYGWFHSGDLGILDKEGFLTVVDRKKDMVKTGGENVSSREVEEVIYLDKRVEEVAVVGLTHPKWVEAVTAVVVPRKGEQITEDEIRELCKKHLAPFKVPKKVIFIDALPKSPTGKILKRELRVKYQDMFK
jgi:fatty-acyl-CoA synthase